MPLVPAWAPNIHPFVIHFPIVLIVTAAVVDLVDVLFERPAWLGAAAMSLYIASAIAAIAAYLTGAQAASTVLIPAMAHPFVAEHRSWALVATWYCSVTVAIRFAARGAGVPHARSLRALLLALGLVAVLLVQQTAERGARLVYQFGTGVIAGPGSR
jgi:uncharacterized membrane protein